MQNGLSPRHELVEEGVEIAVFRHLPAGSLAERLASKQSEAQPRNPALALVPIRVWEVCTCGLRDLGLFAKNSVELVRECKNYDIIYDLTAHDIEAQAAIQELSPTIAPTWTASYLGCRYGELA